MTLEELERAWQEQTCQLAEETRPDVLAVKVAQKDKWFSRAIARRDVGEVATGVAMVAVFAAFGWFQAMWSWYLMSAACLFVVAFLVVDRYIHGEFSTPDNRTIRETLDTLIARTEHQIRLLQGVLWWYILPVAAGSGVVLGHHLWAAYQMGIFQGWVRYFFAGAGLFVVAVNVFIYVINRQAGRKVLEPQRDELLALRQRLGNGQIQHAEE